MTATTTSSETSVKKINIFQVFDYAKDEKTVFWLADIALGTSALWLPLLLSIIFYTKTTFNAELVKLLDAGSGYTFALPFLATSSSFLYLERRKRNVNDLRSRIAPNILTECIVLAILGLIFAGAHFTALIFDKDAGSFFLNYIQFAFVVATIFTGTQLFCLRNINKLPDELTKYRSEEQEKANQIRNQAKNSDSF